MFGFTSWWKRDNNHRSRRKKQANRARGRCGPLIVEMLEDRCLLSCFPGPASDIFVGDTPINVVVGDFNGDGRMDLAVSDQVGGGAAGVLLGNGNGTFGAPTHFSVGGGTSNLIAGDFNGDGKLDLAVAIGGNVDSVGVLLGNGDGTFGFPAYISVDDEPFGLAAGDFNGDGKLDLAVTSNFTNAVKILHGNGDGTFTAGATYAVQRAVGIAAADVNGDGKLDLVAAKFGSGSDSTSIALLLGNGDGTFNLSSLDGGHDPLYVALADFNGDGNLDIAVSNNIVNSSTVSVLLGNGNGTFGPRQAFSTNGSNSNGLVTADFNGDGKADLGVANNLSANVSVLIGNGDGTFGSPEQAAVGSHPQGLATGDFNGDGAPDLATANRDSANVSVLLNQCPPPAVNHPPTVAANNVSVTVNEGQTAGNTGTYNDVDLTDNVIITASVGAVTKTGTNTGTWSWSFTTSDGPTESQIVTITANDGQGGIAMTTFSLTVNNVAPSNVSLTATPSVINEGQSTSLSGSFTDPGTADTHTVVINWGDGSANTTLNLGAGVTSFNAPHTYVDDNPSGTSSDQYTISVMVADDDGASAPLVSGLANYWAGEGNARDTAGGRHGTLQDDTTFAAGKVGQAFRFDGAADGTNDFVSLPGSFGGGTEFSVSAWAKTSGTTEDFQAIFSSTGFEFVHLQLFSSGNNGFYTNNPEPPGFIELPIVSQTPTGVYRHIVLVGKSGDSRLYLDGALVGMSSETFTAIVPSSSMRIGAGSLGQTGRPFKGDIDEVALFSHALSSSEVTQLFNAGNAGQSLTSSSVTVTVNNVAPTVTINGAPASSPEGAAINLTGSAVDPGSADTHTFAWNVTKNGALFAGGSGSAFMFTPDDNGTYVVDLMVTDDDGGSGSDSKTIMVSNVAPTATINSAPPSPMGTAISLSGSLSDPGSADTHTAVFDWGDGTSSPGTVSEANGSGSVTGSHTYLAAGFYTVTLTVTDDEGASAQSVLQSLVIFDPTMEVVTHHGVITSPAGAYAANPALTGKASFSFTLGYEAGASTPTGKTKFVFRVGDLIFQSTGFDWLVVSGAKAQFQGTGTINGAGNYGFRVTVIDGDLPGGDGLDKFRIEIWDKNNSNAVVYDTQMGDPADADPTTILLGGNIIVRKKR